MAYRDTGHEEHEHGHVAYLMVFFALCVFTGISVLADIVHIPSEAVKIVIVMAVACAKATCVLLFFMHLKFEGNWKFILLAPTTILAIGLPIALMPDIATSYYIPDTQQKHDYEAVMAVHGHHEGDGHHGEEGQHSEGEDSHEGDTHDHTDGGHDSSEDAQRSDDE
jgi:cytochrome c oxidase subunit 4